MELCNHRLREKAVPRSSLNVSFPIGCSRILIGTKCRFPTLPAGPLPANGAGGFSNTFKLYDFNIIR